MLHVERREERAEEVARPQVEPWDRTSSDRHQAGSARPNKRQDLDTRRLLYAEWILEL